MIVSLQVQKFLSFLQVENIMSIKNIELEEI